MNDASPKTKKSTALRVLSIIVNVAIYAFFVLCLCLLVLSIMSKRSTDGAINMFGRELRTVATDAMENGEKDVKGYKIKSIPQDSMVFIDKVPEDEAVAEKWYARLKKGDVITFEYLYTKPHQQIVATYRITEIRQEEGGGYYIKLEADNEKYDKDQSIQEIYTSETNPDYYPYNFVIGKVTGQSKFLGFAVTKLKEPVVMALTVIVPSVIIIIYECVRIGGVMSQRKREKATEEDKKKNDEIEELKRKIADMEGKAESESGGAQR